MILGFIFLLIQRHSYNKGGDVMNLLSKVIEQFKSKDWANVKYDYTKLDIDKAKLEYLESPNRTILEYTNFYVLKVTYSLLRQIII